MTRQRASLFAGLAYLGIFVLAILANGVILEGFTVRGDAAASAARIADDQGLFRLGIAALLVVLMLDIVAGWGLYLLLRPVDAALALLSLMFRFAYTVAHIGVVLFLVHALRIAGEGLAFAEVSAALADAVGYFFLRAHGAGFTVTLIFFGAHLVLLGALLWRGDVLPRWLGALVALAGLGYLADGFLWVLFPAYATLPFAVSALIVVLPALVGEGALCVSLIWRGLRWPPTLPAGEP